MNHIGTKPFETDSNLFNEVHVNRVEARHDQRNPNKVEVRI